MPLFSDTEFSDISARPCLTCAWFSRLGNDAKKSISPAFTDNMDFILQSVFYFVTMQSQHFLRPVQSVPYWNDVCQLIVATISPSIPLFATIVAKAAVGPAICTLEPPRNDTRNPAMIAV